MSQAQKMPLVSNSDLANTNPKTPAMVAPIIPFGIPAKWGRPNNMAEIKQMLVGVSKALKGETIPMR